jgi:mono/diheme cytochrome c family protein
MKKILKWVGSIVVVVVVAAVLGTMLRWDRAREVPMPEITASDDPAIIERGRQLVWGPAHCAGCHAHIDQYDHYDHTGEVVRLAGGFAFDIPPGKIVAPNITSDPETGIGKMTDAQIARALRHGVGRSDTMLFPIMPFAHLSDEDLLAVVSYVRTLEPVVHDVAPTELSPLGKFLYAFVIDPAGPTETVPKSVPVAPDATYGEYLAKSVANCYGCHTNRNLATGAFTGEPFSGGLELEHRGKTFTIPNITPGAEGSKIAAFDQAGFIARVRMGTPSAPGSPMPWASFSKMTDDQLTAIWVYLQTVTPVDADRGPALPG